MLASITPLGERGRQSHFWITALAFLLGSALAGLALGAALGAAGRLVLGGLGLDARLIVLAVGLAVAVAIDSRDGSAPGPRRQVNEQWLDRYRGWVYGIGFGAQLGVGVSTVVTSAATYVTLLAALLAGSAGRGALIVGAYGVIRGTTPLLAARVDTPASLLAVHGRLSRVRGAVAGLSLAVLSAALVVALAGGLA